MIDELLQQCTVRINSNGRQGTGFFVASGLILTCAHVVEQASDVINVFWKSQNQHYTAEIEQLITDHNLDLALLKLSVEDLEHPCVYFDLSFPHLNDSLYIFGYPKDYAEDYSDGDSVTIKYEGKSFKGNALLLKLKEGQIKEGFSGSPLLNLRTGGVCGIVNISRNTSIDLGGRAVSTAQIFEHLLEMPSKNRRFHQQDLRWRKLLPSPSPPSNIRSRDVKNRYRLINAVKSQVARWLDACLPYQEAKINLLKETHPKLVKRPGDYTFKVFSKSSSLLPSDTSIVEVFHKESIAGKLLILGEAGTGKTFSLLELATHLIALAETDYNEPIPILLNLSSWNNQKLDEWLVTELRTAGYGVSQREGWKLVKNHKLIPLLDGLDDLTPTQQSKCVSAINKFLSSSYEPKHLVVCSRFTEYTRYYPQLELNEAISLKLLSERQIEKYLVAAKQAQLWKYISLDPNLLDLAKKPLFLFLLTLTFDKTPPQAWQFFTSERERYRYLFDVYVEQILENAERKRWWLSKKPTSKKTKQWLIWLAKRLKKERQKDFFIEKMQPSWLPTKKEKRLYRITSGIIGGLTGSLTVFPLGLPLFAPILCIFSFISGLLFLAPWGTLINGITAGVKKEIKPVETLNFSSKKIFKNFKIEHIISWIIYILLGYFLSLFFGSLLPIIGAMVIAFLFLKFQDSLISNFHGPDLDPDKRSTPNQGIRKSAFNAWILSLIFGLIGGLIGGILFWKKCSVLETELIPIFLIGNTEGILTFISLVLGICPTTFLAIIFFSSLGMIGGGLVPSTACTQHFALRLILWWNGYIPWNYARFLNYATEQGFLQRVGGRYRFIHGLLQEHFAQIPSETD